MNKKQLISRSEALQIEVPEGATNAEISDLIKIAEHPILTKDLAAKTEELSILKEKLTKASTSPVVKKGATYKNEEGTYEFTVANFRFKGQKYTAAEAVENEDLMETLISAKFIHLKKLL